MKRSNVIVTGATGFIGSNLVRRLLELEANVFALVRDTSSSNRLPKHANLTLIQCDLKEIDQLQQILKDDEYDVFYHLGWTGVANTARNELVQLENIELTVNTLRLAKKIKCRRWIGTGSQAEYGPYNEPISENFLPKPITIYGAAKLSACMITQALAQQLDIEYAWVRIFSTYGPGDNSNWMLPTLIKSLINNSQPKLTAGNQHWDYLYIQDAVDALVKLGECKHYSGIFNLGYGSIQTIRSVVELVRDLVNPNFPLVFGELPYRPDQVMLLQANIDKLTILTGWEPKINLLSGLKETIQYYKNCD